jgi:hypothetical protein
LAQVHPNPRHHRHRVVPGADYWRRSLALGIELREQHGARSAVRPEDPVPPKGSPALDPKEFPGLQRYAGQAVDSGPKAKAYANEFIKVHLAGIADGKTYSQVSEASRNDPKNEELAGQVQTLFRGETLRGLLLYAWGWSVVAMIAYWVGIGSLLGAFAVFLALLIGFLAHRRQANRIMPERITAASWIASRLPSASGSLQAPGPRGRRHRRCRVRRDRDDVRVLRFRGRGLAPTTRPAPLRRPGSR